MSRSRSNRPFVLIGSEHSLYTGKLRSYLIWRGLPFVELTASAELYRNVILPRTGVAFIPVLVLPDLTTVLQDTHAIIEYLEQLQQQQCLPDVRVAPHAPSSKHPHHAHTAASSHQRPLHKPSNSSPDSNRSSGSDSHSRALPPGHNSSCCEAPASITQPPYPMAAALRPTTPKQAAASQLLELYGDEWLVLPAMHYRWSFPQQRQRLLYQFGSTNAPPASYEQQMAAGAKVAARFAGMLPGLGISSASIPTIEARFTWQLAVMQEHFKHHAYLLSSCQPSHADFGFIGPLLAHLYIDPVPSCMLQCSAPLVADYIERMSGMHCHARVLDRVIQHGGATAAVSAAAGACAAAAAAQAPGTAAEVSSIAAAAGVLSGSCGPRAIPAGLQPQDPQKPGEGQLLIKLLQQQHHQQQQREGLAGSRAAAAGPPVADVVPATVLPLLHHMFLEQMPVIITTLQLLKAWIQQQQPDQAATSSSSRGTIPASSGTSSHQQQQHGKHPTSTANGSSSGSSSDGSSSWLVVPRFLGRHEFSLYDAATGEPLVPPAAGPLQRTASSYVAWRATEIAKWYAALPADDKAAVQELLVDVSSAGRSSSNSSKSGGDGSSSVPAGRAEGYGAAEAAGRAAAGGAGPVAAGDVDAARAFAEMIDLVAGCGEIQRKANRVVVLPRVQLQDQPATSKL